MLVLDHLKQLFENAFQKAFPGVDLPVEITPSSHGDYQCNSAMKAAKILGKPPRTIAEALINHLKDPSLEKADIAGPGFINLYLSSAYLERKLNEMAKNLRPSNIKPQTILVDFSSPNTAKEMHVGHLRSTIIGDCLCRIFEFFGHNVLRTNHIGDWGTSFGMLIAYILEKRVPLSDASLLDFVSWYKASKQLFDSDELFKKKSQATVVKLQAGDPDHLALWKLICEISRKAYEEIYDLLDIHLIERSESFYNPFLPGLIHDLEQKGLIQISDGAKCLFVPGFLNREGTPLPLMVQKSDGGYNYDTTDLAAIRYRLEEEKADRIIYVTDAGQNIHFQLIFAAAKMAGYLNDQRVDHVPFGLVLGADGKKLKTRSGETIRLIELLQTAIEEAQKLLDQKEVDEPNLAKIMGINAVKYADLSCQRTQDYTFSYERMLRFEGNTAPFLMYAYVRVKGIERKAIDSKGAPILLEHVSERTLGVHLIRFDEVLEGIIDDLLPHRLAEYLYTLAEKFNAFFRDCQVVGSEKQASRLSLARLTASVLKQGMELLGLKTVERM